MENPNNLGKLSDDHSQRDAIDVAIAHGLGEKVRDEAQLEYARRHADETGEDREHASEGDRPRRIPGGQRQHHRGDDPRQRGVRAEDEDATGTEKSIGDQRDQGGIKAGDGWQPGRLCIGHPDRHQDGRQDKSGDDILAEPVALVVLKDLQTWEPAQGAFRRIDGDGLDRDRKAITADVGERRFRDRCVVRHLAHRVIVSSFPPLACEIRLVPSASLATGEWL